MATDTPARGTAPAPPTATVFFTPERPVQGHLFVIRVEPSAGDVLDGVTGEVAGEALHFERTPDDAWESLAAVPIDAADSLPVALALRRAGGGVQDRTPTVAVAPGSYRHERLTVAPRLGSPLSPADQARLARDQEKAREVSRQAHQTPRLRDERAVLPRIDRVTSEFGSGRVFNDQVSSRHMGLDLDGEPGDTVRAAARGVVALVDDFLLAGRIVYLNHGGGLLSGYFHLSEQLVIEGDTVEAATPIGRVGATGRVTGPHLHWVVRYGSVSVDPRSLPGLADTPPVR
jgi:murein DD-endopeptidase MepM/ murein hydrolase activator NlpD